MAHRPHVVRPVPEHWLPVKSHQMLGKAIAGAARAGRFEVVDQRGKIQCRMDRNQQMHMVGLSAKFQQLTAPCRQDLRKRRLQVIPEGFVQAGTPILGHENNV
jgi:hypothetical protein